MLRMTVCYVWQYNGEVANPAKRYVTYDSITVRLLTYESITVRLLTYESITVRLLTLPKGMLRMTV